MHLLEILTPDLEILPEFSPADIEAEIEFHLLTQQLLKAFLQTGRGLDYFEDFLAQKGINPHEYWSVAADNIEFLSNQGEPVEGQELLVLAGG